MTDPVRVRLSRAKGWRMPPNTVNVARPTIWGNLWIVGTPGMFDGPAGRMICGARLSAVDAVTEYRFWLWGCPVAYPSGLTPEAEAAITEYLHHRRMVILARLRELRGKNLGCWCQLDAPCHVDVLLRLANA
ncbi:MAG: DUF4326 domain-containing protein [Gemmatimonadales bacterium]|nr:DUF4326 domain-containing protein [Gemmatimonadales bacterium]